MNNAADKESVKRQERKEMSAHDIRMNDLRVLLSEERGRRHLWHELSKAEIFTVSFTGNSHTFFNEGRRSNGLRLLAELVEADEAGTLKMFSENLKTELNGGN